MSQFSETPYTVKEMGDLVEWLEKRQILPINVGDKLMATAEAAEGALSAATEKRAEQSGWKEGPKGKPGADNHPTPHDSPPPMCGCGHSYTEHQPPRQTFLACHKCKCGDFHSVMVA